MSDETEALRAEVAELRTEVERLNAELAAAKVTIHPGVGSAGGCAGAYAGGAYTYTLNTYRAATPLTITPLHHNTMGAAPIPQIFTYNMGGECA